MSTSVVPTLIDALVTQLPGVMPAGVSVYDGFPLSHGTGDYIAVGVEDPGDPTRANSAMAQQEFAHAAGRARNEEGEIRCAISTLAGSAVMKDARDAAYAIQSAVENLVRAENPPVGVPGIWSAGVTTNSLYQDQSSDGAAVLLVFSIAFKARI